MSILLEMEISIQTIVNIACGFMGLWGFWKVLKEVKRDSDAEHARRQGWDYASKVIKEKEPKWDKGLMDIYEERKQIVERFDIKLADLEDKICSIQCENDAKNQELKAEIMLIIKSLKAVMEGLKEQGCNGPVDRADKELDDFLTSKI